MSEPIPPPQLVGSRDLIIRRVVVTGELGCDVSFSRGLNVVESESEGSDPTASNRAGKTGLVELIRYGLGRRIKSKRKFHFAEVAHRLDSLFLEIDLGDETYVIERSLQQTSAAVLVRRGRYHPETHLTGGSTLSVDELSDWLLSRLGIPLVSVKTREGDLTPLSFPLLSRVFLLHQEYSFGAILQRVDPERRKTDIVGFLTGIIPDRRHAVEVELAQAQRAYYDARNDLDSISRYLASRGVPTALEAQARVDERQAALEAALSDEWDVREAIRRESDAAADIQGQVEGVRVDLLRLKEERAAAEEDLTGRTEERERLQELENSLIQDLGRIERLRSSSLILSTVAFSSCPRCLQPVTSEMEAREDHGHCALCARPLGSTSDDVPIQAPNVADIEAQLEEVREILRSVGEEIATSEATLAAIRRAETDLAAELDRAVQGFVAPSVDRLIDVSRTIAEREKELLQAEALASEAASLSDRRDDVDRLFEVMQALDAERRAVSAIREGRLNLLEQHLDHVLRGVQFPAYEQCRISRQTLMPTVNGMAYESFGLAYKGLIAFGYYMAMWGLAREAPAYMPRTLVIDSPAVGDLNEVSYAQLLRYVAGLQDPDGDPEEMPWQLILTTRRTVPEIDPFVMLSLSSTDGKMLLRERA